jgi:molybdopterin converting factor small subunit
MGMVKGWMLDKHEEETLQELREWFKDRHGRWPKPEELARAEDEKEMEDEINRVMDKDD